MTTEAPSSDQGAADISPVQANPTTSRFPRVGILMLSLGLAIGVLVIDLLTPRGISVAALYVIPVIVVQRAGSIVYTMIVAVISAGLASVGIIVAPDIGVSPSIVLADYGIVLLTLMATAVIGIISSRRSARLQTVSKLLTMCAWTKKVKVQDEWIPVEDYLRKHLGVTISHGMTEESARQFLADSGIEVEETK